MKNPKLWNPKLDQPLLRRDSLDNYKSTFFLEGIKKFVNLRENDEDKSQLKKLILPFDYNAPSRSL